MTISLLSEAPCTAKIIFGAGTTHCGLIPNFQLLLDNSITPQEFTKNVQAQYDKEAKR